MGDSSGEEFYSAPESDGEELRVSSSKLEVETLEKLSLGENNESQSDPDINTPTTEDQASSNKTREPEDINSTATSDKKSQRLEYVSGLDNRLVSDDQEVAEGNKVELSEEQIKVSCETVFCGKFIFLC